jgi:nucleotide-binding universal stress UspA family protein
MNADNEPAPGQRRLWDGGTVGLITNILFPVDFSSACVGMGAYVKRAAMLFGARVTLLHVFDPASHSGLEQSVRAPAEIAADHEEIARRKLERFLAKEFPNAEVARVVVAGDPAREIARVARSGFDLVLMPTHAGMFRRMLLGSTTAKVLNDAGCPVMTSHHAETIAPRPLEHREWLCALGLGEESERVLRFAHQVSSGIRGNLKIIHAIQATDPKLPIQLDLQDQLQKKEREEAWERIEALQKKVGTQAVVRIGVGPVKETLVELARQSDADALMIGRSSRPGTYERLRDLTYAIVRDSPFPVVSI